MITIQWLNQSDNQSINQWIHWYPLSVGNESVGERDDGFDSRPEFDVAEMLQDGAELQLDGLVEGKVDQAAAQLRS